ncbi:helix-turn-helix transcriptional regulator [Asanoa sp. NPDC049518]|uniref:helix-turn-helix domain-containing protein n=1 Tax=unclassified Asanoa TaxID=2685164 RepID=UPI0034424F5D
MDPDTPTSPVIAARRLRALLRRAREVSVTTQAEAASQLGWSMSKLMRIESGTVSVTASDVAALARLYRVGPEIEARLLALAEAAALRGWWWRFRRQFPAPFQTYVGLEWGAASIRLYQLVVMPGLVQTPAYTEHVNRGAYGLPRHEAAAAVRQLRQEGVLNRPRPPQIYVLLDESTIRRVIGDEQVMCGQLRWLLELTRRPNVDIRIRPFTAGTTSYLTSFSLLSFEDDPDIGYIEGIPDDTLLESPEHISGARTAFARMWDESLTRAQTRTLLRRVAEEYGASAGTAHDVGQ